VPILRKYTKNVTKALKEDGIKDISGIDDAQVGDLTYFHPDPNNPTASCLKKGEIRLIKMFIHYVRYREEINDQIGDKWHNITQEEFDQFRCNL
jgi:hypothetical protein